MNTSYYYGMIIITTIISIILGHWNAGLFLAFLFISWILLMQIYRFTTNHLFFPIAVVFLGGYAILISYLIQKFSFNNFIWEYLIITVGFLYVSNQEQRKQKKILEPFFNENKEQKELMETSIKNTIKYHLLSSIIYIVVIILSFLYFTKN